MLRARRVRKSVSHPFHSCQKLFNQATLEAAFFSHGQPRLPNSSNFVSPNEAETLPFPPRELATRRPHGGVAVLSSSRPNLVMYLKTSLLILLLLAPLQKKPEAPVCAVAGEWRLDKVRSPYEAADTLVWRIRVTKARVVWNWQSTKDGEMTPIEYIYKMGHSMGRSKEGRQWRQHVEFDETRLRVWTRFFERQEVVTDWSVHD